MQLAQAEIRADDLAFFILARELPYVSVMSVAKTRRCGARVLADCVSPAVLSRGATTCRGLALQIV